MKRLASLEYGTTSERKRRKATGLRVQLRQRGYQHGLLLEYHSLACFISTVVDSAVGHVTLFRSNLGAQGNTCACVNTAREPAFRIQGSFAIRKGTCDA